MATYRIKNIWTVYIDDYWSEEKLNEDWYHVFLNLMYAYEAAWRAIRQSDQIAFNPWNLGSDRRRLTDYTANLDAGPSSGIGGENEVNALNALKYQMYQGFKSSTFNEILLDMNLDFQFNNLGYHMNWNLHTDAEQILTADMFNTLNNFVRTNLKNFYNNYNGWWDDNGWCVRSCQVNCQSSCQLACQSCQHNTCHNQRCGTH